MKVLYVLGGGSKHEDWEIRWSLRSLVKYARNFEPVIVGKIPKCINPKKVECHEWEDPYRTKHGNIMHHILHAIDDGIVKGEFLYSSDDHFFVKEADFDDYPIWIRQGSLEKEIDYGERPIGKYQRSIIDTRTILEEFGYTYLVFHGHFNTHMHTEEADAVKRMLEVEPRARYGYEPTEMFMNTRTAREDVTATYRNDIKLGKFENQIQLLQTIGENDSFSISDNAFRTEVGKNPEGQKIYVDSGFQDCMMSMYPDKSEFEA